MMRIEQIDQYRWRIPREGKVLVDGIIYADAAGSTTTPPSATQGTPIGN